MEYFCVMTVENKSLTPGRGGEKIEIQMNARAQLHRGLGDTFKKNGIAKNQEL